MIEARVRVMPRPIAAGDFWGIDRGVAVPLLSKAVPPRRPPVRVVDRDLLNAWIEVGERAKLLARVLALRAPDWFTIRIGGGEIVVRSDPSLRDGEFVIEQARDAANFQVGMVVRSDLRRR